MPPTEIFLSALLQATPSAFIAMRTTMVSLRLRESMLKVLPVVDGARVAEGLRLVVLLLAVQAVAAALLAVVLPAAVLPAADLVAVLPVAVLPVAVDAVPAAALPEAHKLLPLSTWPSLPRRSMQPPE
jgi:hypothetical protein